MDLAVILVEEATYPDPAAVVVASARRGVELEHVPGDKPEPMTFELAGGGLIFLMLMPAPHPDVPNMQQGPTSPPVDEMTAAPAHFVVTGLELPGEARAKDVVLANVVGAVIENTRAVAAMLGHGVVFHKAELYAEMAALGVEAGQLPAEIAVDITSARESEDRMSFLTHGLARYDREELYVTCSITGKGALGFVFSIARGLLADPPMALPTGDTIGRTPDEKVQIQRVPNPTGEGADVIRLELP